MKGTVAILKKEVRSYFLSPVAYVVIGIFTFMMGVVFAKFVALYQQYNMQQRFGMAQPITLDRLAAYLYQNMAFVLCFLTPFLTMRLFAEERRQQTLELLLTSPLRGGELVLGKFLSALILAVIMLAVSFVYPAFLIAWGNPDVSIIATTYVGLFFAMSCYIGLGTLISATTNSQAIAAIFTFIALLLLWLLQSFGQGMTASLGPIEWGPTLTYLSPLSHMNGFQEGLIELKAVVYFVTFTVFTLFVTHKVVESNRWR